jgi:histidinol-phosphate aminotransferase
MSKFWSDIANKIEPYVPGEQPHDGQFIKLNTNENPYPPSPKVIEAIDNYDKKRLRLYPDAECNVLRETIARYYKMNKDQVFIGNGSDEVLAFAFMAFFTPGKTILFPDISYSFYPVYSQLFSIDYRMVALDENFNVPIDKFLTENHGIVISNPNAPTTKYIDNDSIKRILEYNRDSVVIVDEAYIDYGGDSMVGLVNEYPNLVIIQTMSKSRALAGMRVGWALGSSELIEGMSRIKNSFNSYTIDSIAQAAAAAAILDEDYFLKMKEKVINTRERISSILTELDFKVVNSKANFIFISHADVSAETIFNELRTKGILVRYFKKPRIDNYLRVSIGTDDEMDKFIEAIKEIIKAKKF